MDDIKAKQQVVDKIKESTSVLVAVSKNPSVDALAAALGLALLIDKLDKHATAVFSGNIPPAINFLQPEKTFEPTTDSLRDFIVALDKEKADHLRLKVEGDLAKIYITPYRTTITSDDLSFSQGDFNVELVIALGVDDQDHLDTALEAHGQILHDAPVITITAGEQTSKLGGIDWHDSRASSLSEMVTGLGEALKDKERLTDQQIATALLTGIVAATDRFSNPRTTSAAMTIAAQLMADGADQQLIAAELEKPQTATPQPVNHEKPVKVKKADNPDGMNIVHGETLAEMDARVKAQEAAEEAEKTNQADKFEKSAEKPENEESGDTPGQISRVHAKQDAMLENDIPSLGGTLNATTDQAEEDSRRELESEKNKTILTHSYVGGSDNSSPMSGATADNEKEETNVDPLSGVSDPVSSNVVHSAYALEPDDASEPIETTEAPEVSDAPAEPAPEPAESNDPAEPPKPSDEAPTPVTPTPSTPPAPADLGLPMPPPLPDFSSMNSGGVNPAYAPEPSSDAPQPERLGDILAPEPTLPATPLTPLIEPPAPPAAPGPTSQNDPAQFKIPGQS